MSFRKEFIWTQFWRQANIEPSDLKPELDVRKDLGLTEEQLDAIHMEIGDMYPDAYEEVGGTDFFVNPTQRVTVADFFRLTEIGGYPARIPVYHELELFTNDYWVPSELREEDDPPFYQLRHYQIGTICGYAAWGYDSEWTAVAWISDAGPVHVSGLDTLEDVVAWLRNLPEEEE